MYIIKDARELPVSIQLAGQRESCAFVRVLRCDGWGATKSAAAMVARGPLTIEKLVIVFSFRCRSLHGNPKLVNERLQHRMHRSKAWRWLLTLQICHEQVASKLEKIFSCGTKAVKLEDVIWFLIILIQVGLIGRAAFGKPTG